MNILELLQNDEKIFEVDPIESKKMQTLVEKLNLSYSEMSNAVKEFEAYAESQLQGELNRKIVMAKSLKLHYDTWQGMTDAYNLVVKEETTEIEKYNQKKTNLLNNLKTMLTEVVKDPVLSLYDLVNGDYVKSNEEHDVIILGTHNTKIIEDMINNFSEKLVVDGHFKEIEAKELTASYANVATNVEMSTQKANELFGSKPNKLAKIQETIGKMEEVGKVVVFFETYRKDLELVGCTKKAMLDYEKAFTKQYIPLKKALQKGLKIQFVEICDIQVDENNFDTVDIENHTQVAEVAPTPVTPAEPVNIEDVNDNE